MGEVSFDFTAGFTSPMVWFFTAFLLQWLGKRLFSEDDWRRWIA
jgi:hypothetical protein